MNSPISMLRHTLFTDVRRQRGQTRFCAYIPRYHPYSWSSRRSDVTYFGRHDTNRHENCSHLHCEVLDKYTKGAHVRSILVQSSPFLSPKQCKTRGCPTKFGQGRSAIGAAPCSALGARGQFPHPTTKVRTEKLTQSLGLSRYLLVFSTKTNIS